MTTQVVNVRREECDVYIGRPCGRFIDTHCPFGNPFRPGRDGTPEECMVKYESYFYTRMAADSEFRRQVGKLKGKRLGCWCAQKGGVTAEDRPWVCHGQVIAAYVDGVLP